MLVPDETLVEIVEFLKESYDFDFTTNEVQALCDESHISEPITEGWPDTGERELLMDALATKFAGRPWPTYGDDADEQFADKLVLGYMRWRWGDLEPGDHVRFTSASDHLKRCTRAHGPTDRLFQVSATSFTQSEAIVPLHTWMELDGHEGRVGLGCVERAASPCEIVSDGKTVWVNSSDGMNLGRFSHFGIDIHKDFAAQDADGNQCLDCKAGPLSLADWERFKAGMLQLHKVEVTNHHMPSFLREKL